MQQTRAGIGVRVEHDEGKRRARCIVVAASAFGAVMALLSVPPVIALLSMASLVGVAKSGTA